MKNAIKAPNNSRNPPNCLKSPHKNNGGAI